MEQILQHWINREATSPFLDQVMAAITNYSAWFPVIVLAVALAAIFGNFKMRMMLVCLSIAFFLTDGVVVNTIKHLVGRPRPLQVEPGVRVVQLVHASPQMLTLCSPPEIKYPVAVAPSVPVKGRSFPSSHTANIFVTATVLFLFYRRWGFLFYAVALLVLYSRIYTGAHWPLDVAVGACIGIINGVVIVSLMNRCWEKWGRKFFPVLAEKYRTLNG